MVELVDNQVLSCLLPYLSSHHIHTLLLTSKSLNELIVDNDHFWEERYIRDFTRVKIAYLPPFRSKRPRESYYAYFVSRAGKFAIKDDSSLYPSRCNLGSSKSSKVTLRTFFSKLLEDEWIVDLRSVECGKKIDHRVGDQIYRVTHILIAVTNLGGVIMTKLLANINTFEHSTLECLIGTRGDIDGVRILKDSGVLVYRPGKICRFFQSMDSTVVSDYNQCLTTKLVDIMVRNVTDDENKTSSTITLYEARILNSEKNPASLTDAPSFSYPFNYRVLAMASAKYNCTVYVAIITQKHFIIVPHFIEAKCVTLSERICVHELPGTETSQSAETESNIYDEAAISIDEFFKVGCEVLFNFKLKLQNVTYHGSYKVYDDKLDYYRPFDREGVDINTGIDTKPGVSNTSIEFYKAIYEPSAFKKVFTEIPPIYGKETVQKVHHLGYKNQAIHLVEFSGHTIDTDKLYQIIEDMQATPEEMERAKPLDHHREQLRWLYPQHDMYFIEVPRKFEAGSYVRSVIMH